jgi:carbonic anhydrase
MKRTLALTALLLFSTFNFAQQSAPAKQPAHAAHHATEAAKPPSADTIWAGLMAGNARFIAGTPKSRQLVKLRQSLAGSQAPHVIVLACSDSRVAPETIFDQNLGDLFVIRAAGNITDALGLASMEYAVEHLGSSVLVVLGHSKCGAVTAACSGDKMDTPNLQAMVDQIAPAVSQAKSQSAKDLVETAIVENVHQSAKDVMARSEALRHFRDDGKLTVIEAEYHLDSGKVVRVDKPAGMTQ